MEYSKSLEIVQEEIFVTYKLLGRAENLSNRLIFRGNYRLARRVSTLLMYLRERYVTQCMLKKRLEEYNI